MPRRKLPGDFFDFVLGPDKSGYVLGVTCTWYWIDGGGAPTDIDGNGELHFAPLAVMNAGYTGMQQELAGTDTAAFCSLWATWPRQ